MPYAIPTAGASHSAVSLLTMCVFPFSISQSSINSISNAPKAKITAIIMYPPHLEVERSKVKVKYYTNSLRKYIYMYVLLEFKGLKQFLNNPNIL